MFAEPARFDVAVASVPEPTRDAAWAAYLTDPRDTASPEGMVSFLTALASYRVLSRTSTDVLLAVMTSTTTGPDRLKAGLPLGWQIAHKTGTGRAWRGMTSDTNDVGIITAPDGGRVAIAVFVAASTQSNDQRAGVIAAAARAATGAYQPQP